MADCVTVSGSISFADETLRTDYGEDVPYVRIDYARMETSQQICRAREWLADESRPGVFGLLRTSVGYFFAISDPDVAFEFRLRFG